MNEPRPPRAFLARSCIGCILGVAGIVALLAVIAAIGWVGAQNGAPVEKREAPALATAEAGSAAGQIEIDVARTDLVVEPAAKGEKARVEAQYDEKLDTFEEKLARRDDGSWSWTIRFQPKKTGVISFFERWFAKVKPKVHVFLPREGSYDLAVSQHQAGAEVELGALPLRTLSVHNRQGGLELHVSEPSPSPLERVELRSEMGGVAISQLGNTSAVELDVTNRMGGFDLDLGGEWRNDAAISLSSAMGGMSVHLPKEAVVRGVPGRAPTVETPGEVHPPILDFTLKGKDIDFSK